MMNTWKAEMQNNNRYQGRPPAYEMATWQGRNGRNVRHYRQETRFRGKHALLTLGFMCALEMNGLPCRKFIIIFPFFYAFQV